MKNIKNIIISLYTFIIVLCIISCEGDINNKEDCIQYRSEDNIEVATDTSLLNEVLSTQKYLLEKFGESSIEEVDHDAYHLLYFSSHGFGRSVKIEKLSDYRISLKVTCYSKVDWNLDCKNIQMSLTKDDWLELEKMIYEFDFWTTEEFRKGREVLDGDVYILNAHRPDAEKCHKKTRRIIARGSPQFDKMGSLCELIIRYADF